MNQKIVAVDFGGSLDLLRNGQRECCDVGDIRLRVERRVLDGRKLCSGRGELGIGGGWELL